MTVAEHSAPGMIPDAAHTGAHRVTVRDERRARLLLLGITLIGLALRIAGAQGSLWLDEAWSAMLAAEVKTPLGVLVGINHDNNHHLNSLWMQWLGLAAPTWQLRFLSVLTGTLSIPVAAAIARPRGIVFALVTALLFAISPVLVTLGSEARGYAPMALALMVAILFVDRTLAGDESYHRPTTLALCFVLGALAQLTMVFGILALTGWALIAWWRRDGFGPAIKRWFALFALPLVALAALLGLMVFAALSAPRGFQFGYYEPFAINLFFHAMVELAGYTIGFPVITILLPLGALLLLVLAPRANPARVDFYRLAIAAFPATMVALRAGNPGHPRYYLLVALALLLMLGEMIGAALMRPGRIRIAAGTALAVVAAGSLVQDADLAINRRGDPAAAVRELARLRPKGADVLMDRNTGEAMIRIAALQARYPLRLTRLPCPAHEFVFVDRYKGEARPVHFERCGAPYAPILDHQAHGLSGTHWTLYRRVS